MKKLQSQYIFINMCKYINSVLISFCVFMKAIKSHMKLNNKIYQEIINYKLIIK